VADVEKVVFNNGGSERNVQALLAQSLSSGFLVVCSTDSLIFNALLINDIYYSCI